MKFLSVFAAGLALAGFAGITGGAHAETWRVPADFLTIQDAVDAALPGDQIRVSRGDWCGAIIDIKLDLVAQGGATIVGCESPNVDDLFGVLGFLRIGFILFEGASGTTIRHFTFDGEGVHNTGPDGNFEPLSLAIFGYLADNVIIEQNLVVGTAQAVSNSSGSGWTVNHNVIEDLVVFPCDGVKTCLGGLGIVFQHRGGDPRPTDNTAMFNDISGTVPDTLMLFDTAAIWLLAQDGAVVKNNRIVIPGNDLADGKGVAILANDACCGLPVSFNTTINSVIVNNDGRGSEVTVFIPLDAGLGTGNTVGTTLRGNFGVNIINDDEVDVQNRSIHTLVEF